MGGRLEKAAGGRGQGLAGSQLESACLTTAFFLEGRAALPCPQQAPSLSAVLGHTGGSREGRHKMPFCLPAQLSGSLLQVAGRHTRHAPPACLGSACMLHQSLLSQRTIV